MRVCSLKLAGASALLATLLALFVFEYARNGTRRWFTDALPEPYRVQRWTDAELDAKLYKLSRWEEFDPAQFQSFVAHQIRGLALNDPHEAFHFLEVGVGVGAFARHLLRQYPNATGVGLDLEPKAISIAAAILPRERMALQVGDMRRLPAPAEAFDYVLAPGSLCYLHSLDDVRAALAEFVRVLRPGGGLCASMLASATSGMGSCNLRIPKSVWLQARAPLGLRVVSVDNMDDWKLPHAFGRYAICLRKKRGASL